MYNFYDIIKIHINIYINKISLFYIFTYICYLIYMF